MGRITDEDIARVTGRPAPEKQAPTNRREAAVQALSDLDGRVADLVEEHRRPGESHAQAHSRLLMDSPRLYSETKAAKAAILKAHGLGDAAVGGLV
ncbi:MAG: hypothetical protein ACHP7N_11310 [Caulobacterales bacterium]